MIKAITILHLMPFFALIIMAISNSFASTSCSKDFLKIFNEGNYPVESFLALQYRKRKAPSQLLNREDDLRAISLAYENLRPDAPKINFEITLEALMGDLMPREREIVWSHLNNVYYSPRKSLSNSSNFQDGGRFFAKKMKITIDLPSKYHGTDLDYFIRLHEAYHLIAKVVIDQRLSTKVQKSFFNIGQKIRRVYLEEMGAMAQEWYYFANMPLKEREAFKSMLIEDKDLNESFKSLVIDAIENADKSPQAHVYSQHLAKRYDPRSMKADYLIRRDMQVMTAAFLPAMGFLAWTFSCLKDTEKTKGRRANQIFCDYHPFLKSNAK